MSKRRLELADVFREHGSELFRQERRSLSKEERKVLDDIVRCRTAALGGHKWHCPDCGHEEIAYNSCRNRHCPKCQASARAEWLEREAEYLLDVEYFHLVFTLPADLGSLALRNKRKIYGALFRAAQQTLSTIARDPKHLGAEIGCLMVLHTWGQKLNHHPHMHCVVPGGGLSLDGSQWISSRKGFFLPVRVLSRLFRGKFLDRLRQLYESGELFLGGRLEPLKDLSAWNVFLKSLRRSEWVVYSKPPFGGPGQVLKYLARYTHRVAISNQRILSLHSGQVRFRYKDYARGNKKKVMTLKAQEFIRRFLLHVLPRGFVRIRHYGFLSNRARKEKLALARRLIGESPTKTPADVSQTTCTIEKTEDARDKTCPRCKEGRLVLVAEVRRTPIHHLELLFDDSS